MHLAVEICLHFDILIFLILSIVIFILLFVLIAQNLLLKLNLFSDVFSTICDIAFTDTHSFSDLIFLTSFSLLFLLLRTKAVLLEVDGNITENVA